MQSSESFDDLSCHLPPDLVEIVLSYLKFDPHWRKVDEWETPVFLGYWGSRFSNPSGITKISGTQAAVLEGDSLRFVCLQTGAIQKTVEKCLDNQAPGKIISFPANRQIVATKSYTGFRVYNGQGSLLYSVPNDPDPLSWMRGSDIAKLNKRLLVVATTRRVSIFDLHRREFIYEWEYDKEEKNIWIDRVRVAKIGPWKILILGTCARVLDLRRREVLARWGKFDDTPYGVVKISGNRIAISTLERSIQIYNIQTGQLLNQFGCQEKPRDISGRQYADSCRGIDRIGKYRIAVSDRRSITFYTEFPEWC